MILAESTLENGDRVLEYIKNHPGCYLRQIKTNLGISMGTTQYHLNYLLNSKKITSIRRGLRKFYFVNGVFCGINACNILQVLSQETAREILLFIAVTQNPTHSDLVKRIGISGASVNWNIKRLLEFKLIRETKSGKYKRYKVAADTKTLIDIIKNFNPGIWDRWNDRLTDIVLSLSGELRDDNE